MAMANFPAGGAKEFFFPRGFKNILIESQNRRQDLH